MKNIIIFILLFVLPLPVIFAQEKEKKEKDLPVYSVFESGILIDNQTTVIPDKKTLEYVIQHKFGSLESGASDVWGIYSPGANIRLGINYVPLKNFQIGVGKTKKNKYSDFNAKWLVLQQTRKNKIPVSVALYGMMAIDGRDLTTLGSGKTYHPGEIDSQYSPVFSDRLSYFSQLIISRKFTEGLSLQGGISFTHYNLVEKEYDHDKIALHFNGRVKISQQTSLIFNYDAPLKIQSISEQTNWDTHAKPNLAFGIEMSTGTHAFQIFAGTANGIIPQDVVMYNQNEFTKTGLAIGFTITRLWMF